MNRFIAICLSILFLGTTGAAQANTKLRGEVFCFPAKQIPQLVKSLSSVDQDRRNIVDVGLQPKFLIKDGGNWPERFFIRTDSQDIDIPIEKPSGLTPTFLSVATEYSDGDVCVADKARAHRPENDEGLYFEMGLSPLFHSRSGRHEMDELEEGAKDGKSFYKKMIPRVARMLMPDTDYLAIRYDDFRKTSEVFAEIEGQRILIQPKLYKDMHVVSFEALEDMNASALIISGGPYQLQPTVSVKTMKRFGWGEDQSDDAN